MFRLNLTFVSLILLSVGSVYGQKKAVSIKFSFTVPYCGGARPSQEILAEAEKPKPYANKTVIVVLLQTGKADSAKTNPEGVLKLKLKKGDYKLYEPWRYYKSNQNGEPMAGFDKDCLKSEWEKQTFDAEVTRKGVKVTEVNPIVRECGWRQPCLIEGSRRLPE